MLIDVWFFAVCLFTAFWCGMGCCAAGFLLCARIEQKREERLRRSGQPTWPPNPPRT